MADKAIVMSWSKCAIKIGTSTGAMATLLQSIGMVKDRSTTLEASEGDVLEAIASGGERVAKEALEGGFTISTRVIEPSDDLIELLGIGTEKNGELQITTHLINQPFSIEITPKNVGARGIRAPYTNITYRPGWSEEEGFYADLEFEVLRGTAGYWYSHFRSAGLSATAD